MTEKNDDLMLDVDGIPILTDLVHEGELPPDTSQPAESFEDETPADDLTAQLLDSDIFRQQLDDIATELTRTVHEQIEQNIMPVLEEYISVALNDSTTASYEAMRERIEAALPDLLSRTLKD